MSCLRTITVLVVIGISTGLSAARSESEAEDNFKVTWSSITYNKRLALRNPAVSKGRERELSETLSLSSEIEILDPSRVLGVCRKPIIEKITDGGGKNVEIDSVSAGSGDMKYDLLRYRRRSVKYNPARLENAVRSVLRLPRRVGSRQMWLKELESSRMQIDLDAGLSKRPGEEIGRVKGHFYVLMAESLEYVDVPFKQNDDWVRLTPDMEIRVGHAMCEESKYRLSIAERPETEGSMPPLYVRSYLPQRLAVARYLVGPDDKPLRYFRSIRDLPDPLNDRGEAVRGRDAGQIKKIRYVIAVNPTHHRIPFVLENIPLPKP